MPHFANIRFVFVEQNIRRSHPTRIVFISRFMKIDVHDLLVRESVAFEKELGAITAYARPSFL